MIHTKSDTYIWSSDYIFVNIVELLPVLPFELLLFGPFAIIILNLLLEL